MSIRTEDQNGFEMPYLVAWYKGCPKVQERLDSVESLVAGDVESQAHSILEEFVTLIFGVCKWSESVGKYMLIVSKELTSV